jgi:hypothetical protein
MTPLCVRWDFTRAQAFTPTQRRLWFEGAAQRWSYVVLGWPAHPGGSPVSLNNGAPLRYLQVSVEIGKLPKDVVGFVDTAKNKLLRLGSNMGRAAGLPYQGTIRINGALLENAATEPGRFKDCVVHELGHILGAGTVFHEKGLVQKSGRSYFFKGAAAMRAYAKLLGRKSGAEKVPLVREPGGSSPAYHWNEKKLRLEIMSERLDKETATTRAFEFNAISAVTVGALKDIGYEVDMQNAEPLEL